MAVRTRFRKHPRKNRSRARSQQGFGLIEVMLAMLVSMVGLVTLLALFAQAIATTQVAQLNMIARQKARESLESIFSARNTHQITFDMIQSVGDGGVFLEGYQPLLLPNPEGGSGDGLIGTADDGSIEEMILPGPDGYMGTEDDKIVVLDQFERQIEILPILMQGGDPNPDIRELRITVRYRTPIGALRTYTVGSYVSRFR